MSYPAGVAESKHDLVTPRLPLQGTLLDAFGLASAATLFQKLDEAAPRDLKLLASVYSYADGPQPPLSRSLYVVGIIADTHTVMRKLVGDEQDGDELDPSLHRCTLAVNRGDGNRLSEMDERHRKSSVPFAKFIQRLRIENVAAVLGHDKYKRMGILKALRRPGGSSGYHENDFHVACYVGYTEKVKDALRKAVVPAMMVPKSPPVAPGGFPDDEQNVVPKSPPVPPGGFHDEEVAPQSPPPPPGGFNDEGPVWNPDCDEPVWQPDDAPVTENGPSASDDTPVWKPEDNGSDDTPNGKPEDNGASTTLWEAPGRSSNDASTAVWEAPASSSTGLWESGTADDNAFGAGTVSDWDQVDTTISRKRSRPEDDNDNNLIEDDEHSGDDDGDKFHANTGAAAADKFYSNLTRNQGTRADSRLYHMRSFNGWVKATQIQGESKR
eukprot:scaffold1168_cov167-Amphora_coffeaeformis.AAC.29